MPKATPVKDYVAPVGAVQEELYKEFGAQGPPEPATPPTTPTAPQPEITDKEFVMKSGTPGQFGLFKSGGETFVVEGGKKVGTIDEFKAQQSSDPTTGMSNLQQQAMQSLQNQSDFFKTQAESYITQMDQMKAAQTAANKNLINSIQTSYNNKIKQMSTLNQIRQGNVQTAQFRSGRARYAPTLAEGAVSAEESAGLSRIAGLESQKNSLIGQAKNAAIANDYKMLNDKMNMLGKLQGQQTKALQDQLKMSQDFEKQTMDKAKFMMDMQAKQFTLEQETAEGIATSLYNQFGDDIDENNAVLQEAASQYGLDPNMLASTVEQYAKEEEEFKLAYGKELMNIAGDIPEGSMYTIPGTGITVEGTKEPDTVDVTKTIGNTEYKIRYAVGEDGLTEQFKIELGPRWKGGGGGGGIGAGGFPKGFWSAVKTANASLKKGEDWGTVWNRMNLQFPTVAPEQLDVALGTEWREEGAFEEFKQKQYKETAPRKFEQEAGIWKEIGTADFQSAPREQQIQYIQSQGFDPGDFNIY
jgi:hypothetical protein